MLRDWIGTWTQAMVPTLYVEAVDGSIRSPTGVRSQETRARTSKSRSHAHVSSALIALAEVLMMLAESCVIEQHIDRHPKGVEPTNLGAWHAGCGGTDRARLHEAGRTTWRWYPRKGHGADVMLPLDLENACGRALRSTCLEAARRACLQFASICAAQWEPCDTRFWQRCDDGWAVDSTTRGGWQGSRAMQVMFGLGLEFALSKSDEVAPR